MPPAFQHERGLISDHAIWLFPIASCTPSLKLFGGVCKGYKPTIRQAATTERLVEADIKPSLGSLGDRCNNALPETSNVLFKVEISHNHGPLRSFEAVEYATLEWVECFNRRRLPAHIRNIPPLKLWKLNLSQRNSPQSASGEPGSVCFPLFVRLSTKSKDQT